MAGGMNKRGRGIPMSRRVTLGRDDEPGEAPVDDCPARHCWVLDPADRSHCRRPGLLLEWRRTASGDWEGRVVYAAELHAGLWAAVEEWVPAVLVERVAASGPGHEGAASPPFERRAPSGGEAACRGINSSLGEDEAPNAAR